MVAILLVAAFLRSYRLGEVPRGLFYDEAANGVDAERVLYDGYHPIWFAEGNENRRSLEPLVIYLQAASLRIFGAGHLALRAPLAALGVLGVLVAYLLGREAFGERVGLITALLQATSYWPVAVDRTAMTAGPLAATGGLAALFLCRALRDGRRRDYLLAGATAGLNLYVYLAGRVFVLALGGFGLYLWAQSRWRGVKDDPRGEGAGRCVRTEGVGLSPRRTQAAGVHSGSLTLGTMAALVVALPMLGYLVLHPGAIGARLDTVLVGGPTWEATLRALGHNLASTVSMLIYSGDQNWRHNLPGLPVFAPPVAALFALGLALLIRHWAYPPAALTLVLCACMLLPTLLTSDNPNFLRAGGALPFLFIPAAVGADWLLATLESRWAIAGRGGAWPGAAGFHVLALAWLAWAGSRTYVRYFHTFAESRAGALAFDADLDRAAQSLRDAPDGATALVGLGRYYTHPVFRFYDRRPRTLRWFDARQSLVFPAQVGKAAVYLLPLATTPLDVQRYLPAAARAEDRDAFGGFASYRLTPQQFRASREGPRLAPIVAQIGDVVQLLGEEHGAEAPQGGALPLTLLWQVRRAAPGADYAFFSHLSDIQGETRGQGDANEFYTDGWQPGDLVIGRYDLRVQPDAPPGRYRLRVGLYDRRHPERPLPVAGGGASVEVGTAVIRRDPPLTLADVPKQVDATFGGVASLIGLGAAPRQPLPNAAAAGQPLSIDLFWQAPVPIPANYTVFVHLLDEQGRLAAGADAPPDGGRFPTSAWKPGEIVEDRHSLAVPATARGAYRLEVGLYEPASGRRLALAGGGDAVMIGSIVVW